MQSIRRISRGLYPAAIILLAFFILLPVSSYGAPKKKFTVVIDAGHGGNDFGAIENGVNEKDVNLAVALKLGEMIQKKLKDTEVVYTRNTDKFISLQNRADIANKAKGDLFISIHCNSVDRSNKNRSNVLGASTYVLGHHKDADNLAVAKRENSVIELDANDKAHFSGFDATQDESFMIFEMAQKKNFQNSVRFASDVQKEMAAAGRYSRGVHQAGFWVLWSTAMPAALIELDFICNPEQAKFLNSKEGQDKLAGVIFNAVKKYESYFKKSMGLAETRSNDPNNISDEELAEIIIANSQSPSADSSEKKTKVNSKNSDKGSNTKSSGGTTLVQEEIAIAEAIELPSAQDDSSERQHRASAAHARRQSNSHRRRSSNARLEGTSQIEETTITLGRELAANSIDISGSQEKADTGKDLNGKEKEKTVKKENLKENKKSVPSKPARRDKNKNPGRKAVKSNVSVSYKILLFASDDELKANDEAFQGLTPVSSFRENNKYNYTYGESTEYKEMENLLKEISAIFPEARVIKRYQ